MPTQSNPQHVRGEIELPPRFRIPATQLVRIGEYQAIVGVAPLDVMKQVVEIPVFQRSNKTSVPVRQVEGWQRMLQPERQTRSITLPYLVLSSRERWAFNNGSTDVYNNAWVIDGAKRLNALAATVVDKTLIPFIAYVGLRSFDEIQLRSAIASDSSPVATETSIGCKVGTNTQRLIVDDNWVEITVESNPFVVPTARGYTPGLLVRRAGSQIREHLLVQAQSLSEPLESLRLVRGDLIGIRLLLRKETAARTSPYEVCVVEG